MIRNAPVGEHGDYLWVGPVGGPGDAGLFGESSATASIFFCNCQLAGRTFFKILSNLIELFPEFSGNDPLFF